MVLVAFTLLLLLLLVDVNAADAVCLRLSAELVVELLLSEESDVDMVAECRCSSSVAGGSLSCCDDEASCCKPSADELLLPLLVLLLLLLLGLISIDIDL